MHRIFCDLCKEELAEEDAIKEVALDICGLSIPMDRLATHGFPGELPALKILKSKDLCNACVVKLVTRYFCEDGRDDGSYIEHFTKTAYSYCKNRITNLLVDSESGDHSLEELQRQASFIIGAVKAFKLSDKLTDAEADNLASEVYAMRVSGSLPA